MLQIPCAVQPHKSRELTSQGTQTELGMRSWRANTHEVDVKQWKSSSNINSSLLAYVTYLMYVSQDPKTARVTCRNQHMPGTFQVLTYWAKQQVQGEEQHECISIFHSPGSREWETFCICQRQYQLYTETLRHAAHCATRQTHYMNKAGLSTQAPKYLMHSLPVHISVVQTWNWQSPGQVTKPTNSHCANVQVERQCDLLIYRSDPRGSSGNYRLDLWFWLLLLFR